MTRAVEQISALAGVQVKEDAGNNNDLLLQASLEEVETVVDLLRQSAQVEPDVERRVGSVVELESHSLQAAEHVVTLLAEVVLQGLHLVADFSRLQHGNGCFLEGYLWQD